MLARKHLKNIITYKPGKPAEELKREFGLKKVIKLASNENPIGTSPKALEAIESSSKNIYRYPPDKPFSLREKIAKRYKLTAKNIILGNGSDEIIELIVKTFLNNNDEVVLSEPDFLIYKLVAKTAGAKIISVPARNFKTDLKGIKTAINRKTKLIFISNPNNPLGSYLNQNEVKDFLKDVPKNVIIVFDQAYAEFVEISDYPTMIEFLNNHNLILLRTFSKFYGLAGLRIGYGISQTQFINYLNKACLPFNVNYLAQQAAAAVLDDKLFLTETKKAIKKGKKYICGSLDKLNFFYINSATNFITIDVKMDGQKFCRQMLNWKIIVRDLKPYKLNNFVRLSIGKQQENKKFIEALKASFDSCFARKRCRKKGRELP